MRTSSDFFDQPGALDSLDEIPGARPTVPFSPETLSIKPTLPPIPKVSYPVHTPPPPPQTSALEQIELAIQKEVSELKQSKPTLDQIIQNALKQKIQIDQQKAQQKVMTFKKSPQKPVQIRPAPAPQPTFTPGNPPFQQPPINLWWPNQKEIITEKLRIQKLIKPVHQAPTPTITPVPIKVKSTPEPLALVSPFNPITLVRPSALSAPAAVVKTAFHVSTNFLNYFTFSISQESDPFDDSNRQKIIYGIKIGAYLTILAGVFELMRAIGVGLSTNGILEVMSFFLISAILFFFGENLSILFKPSNPYQIHEVV